MSQRKDHDPEYKLNTIWSKCVMKDSCLEWTGTFFKRYGSRNYKNDHKWGYPYMYFKNKRWRGNRLVMYLLHGSIPDGMNVLHNCDNMKCLNPKHLYFGTPKDNAIDAVKRKRNHNSAKTKCIKGHKLTKNNTLYTKRNDSFYRRCRECHRLALQKYWEAIK